MVEKKNNQDPKTDEIKISHSSEINIGKWINEGWDFVMAHFAEFLILSLLYSIIIILASSTILIKFLFAGPLKVGIFFIIFNRMRGKSFNIGDIVTGFNYFIPAVLADILITVFAAFGYFFLIIPGIIISAVYMFTFPLILEKKMDFWQAMETSRKVVSKNLFELSVFMLVLHVFLLIGVILLFVGVLVAVPIVFAAIAAAYRDIFGLEEEVES